MLSNHLVFCCPLLLLPSIFPNSRVFSNESALYQIMDASAPILPMNIQNWFPSGWTNLVSLLSKGLSRVFSSHLPSKVSILWWSAITSVYDYLKIILWESVFCVFKPTYIWNPKRESLSLLWVWGYSEMAKAEISEQRYWRTKSDCSKLVDWQNIMSVKENGEKAENATRVRVRWYKPTRQVWWIL